MICLQHMKRLALPLLIIAAILLVAFFLAPSILERRMNKVLRPPPYQPSAAAEELHNRLIVADLHADSLLWGRNLLKQSSRGHVDLPRLQQGHVAIQAFTIVSTSPRNLNIYKNSDSTDQIQAMAIVEGWPPRTWNSPRQRALYQAARLNSWLRGGPGLGTVKVRDLRRGAIRGGFARGA